MREAGRDPLLQVVAGQVGERQGRVGEPAGALPDLEESVAIYRAVAAEDDRRRARAESTLGLCLLRLGRVDEAEPLLAQSLAQLARFETAETVEARRNLEELRALRGS